MNYKMTIPVLVAIIAIGCGPEITNKQKLESLEAERSQVFADLFRQKAECQAQAVEFANDPARDKVIESCLAGYRVIAEAARTSIENIDRRIAELTTN